MKYKTLLAVLLLTVALILPASAYDDDGVWLHMDYNGGTWQDSEELFLACTYGEDVTQIGEPIRPGYQFGGWYTDQECTKPWMEKEVFRDTTIYAKWMDLDSIMPSLDNFVRVNRYQPGQFKDVSSNAWYADNVAVAYELGLMKGSSATQFNVTGNVTVAEAITMAARLHSIYFTGSENFIQTGNVWYQTYVTYAAEHGILSRNYNNYTRPVTRGEFAEIFCNAFPGRALVLQNGIEDGDIPDVKNGDDAWSSIYCLYRAGILTGSDKQGSFYPQRTISRTEAAAIVTRMADQNLRKSFSLENENAMVDYVGKTVSEVANEFGWDFTYGDEWWYGAAKAFYYDDNRTPFIFFFIDNDLKGYASGNETVDILEFYSESAGSCSVAPGISSDLTYPQIKNMGLPGNLQRVEEEGGEIGNTVEFQYRYNEHITIVFYWYEDHSPYIMPADSVSVYWH